MIILKKTVIELFAGVGGFRVGLNKIEKFNEKTELAVEKGTWNFVWANQWEPATTSQPAYDCYIKRFGEGSCVNEDIHEIVTHKMDIIPEHALLVGGFPCQDYSVARSLSGEQGITGKKGVLFWDIAAIVEAKKPPFILLENVDRLLKSPSKQRGRDFGIMLRTLHDNGYNVEWRVINAADYGARQRRRRTFIYAWRQNTKYQTTLNDYDKSTIILKKGLFARTFPITVDSDNWLSSSKDLTTNTYIDTVELSNTFKMNFENSGCMINGIVKTINVKPVCVEAIPLSETLQHNVDEKYYLTPSQHEKFSYLKGAKKIDRVKPNGEPYVFSEGPVAYPEPLDGPSRTMLTSEGTVNRSTHVVADLDTGNYRLITPVEAERLQHFPDDWTNTGMNDRQRYFMMGNALVTYIIKELESNLAKIINNE